MGGHDQLPDDGRNPTQEGNEAATPRAEGGETPAPGSYPPVRKDDSVQVGDEGRSFEDDTAHPASRRRDEGVDPAVSHGGDAGPDDDSPDAR